MRNDYPHQANYHRLPCPIKCLFVKYESKYGFRRKMTFKLPRLRTDMIKKACLYKSITRWNALEFVTLTLLKSHSVVLLSHIYCKYVEFLY